ncbi:MAG: acyl-CoA thioesterase [Candidatus Eisenbacteria bacterium]|uniref:Acyl-CoA thioesterase n=1 Tax=Eiseniibacteriota bacterium TaxID=2212470 RepID=A0A538UC28_UNCEI|nr:MAG: acyl-CoA thioesterase [Candidatus Eisenbacteria bacterium]
MHRYGIRVRYADTDQMGFAYYAHYLRWFEIGRAEMLRALGWSYRSVEEAGIQLPVLEARCRYQKPARYDDELTIQTGVLEVRRASVRFGYRVVREPDGEVLASGEIEHCFLDRDGKPARPPARLTMLLNTAPRAGA